MNFRVSPYPLTSLLIRYITFIIPREPIYYFFYNFIVGVFNIITNSF